MTRTSKLLRVVSPQKQMRDWKLLDRPGGLESNILFGKLASYQQDGHQSEAVNNKRAQLGLSRSNQEKAEIAGGRQDDTSFCSEKLWPASGRYTWRMCTPL